MAYNFLNQTAYESKITALGSFFSYPLTINCWFYPTVSGLGRMDLVSFVENTASVVHILRLNSDTNIVEYNTNSPASASSSASYTTNTWNMATAVGTSATSRTVYLNAAN